MKAIIPVAGAGTKLRPLTYTQPKALIPIAGKTILGVIVDQLLDAGVTEFVFVIGYLGEKIQRYIAKTYPGLKHTFVSQNDRRGTGHAIWLTRDAVGDDEVMIVLGDTVCDYNVRETLSITDRSYLIYNGQLLIEGTAEVLLNDPKARELYLGWDFKM